MIHEEHYKNIAILQLSRTGDIVQTLLALESFKRKYPEKKITLIVRPEFLGNLAELYSPYWDDLIFYEKDKTFQCDENFDLLINLTFSEFSSHLSSQIKSKEKWGMHLNKEKQLVIKDHWSQFIFSNTMCGPYSPFNLVDLFKFILGTHEIPAKNSLVSKSLSNNIIIHPFASQEKKKWKTHKWSSLIEKIAESLPEITMVLVGNSNEVKEANSIMELLPQKGRNIKIKNLCGELSLKELSLLLKDSSCFLGHDSMVGHLASLNKVPCITLSLGTVRPFETSPYGENNIIFIPQASCFPCEIDTLCSYMVCHNEFHMDSLLKAISHQINKKPLLESDFSHGVQNIFRTYSEKGLQYIEPIAPNLFEKNIHELFRKFYLVIWSFIFEEIDLSMSNKLSLDEQLNEELNHYFQALNQLEKLYEFSEKYTKDLLELSEEAHLNLQKIKDITNKLKELDDLSLQLKKNTVHLSPIINFHQVVLANIRGNGLNEQAAYSLLACRERIYIIQILKDFIQQVLNMSSKDSSHSKQQSSHPEPRSGS